MIDTQQTASPGVQPADAQPIDSDVAQRAREQRSQRVLAGRLASRMRTGARGRRHGTREGLARNPATPTTYDSLGAFVSEDPRRELRHERELGDFWLGDGFPSAAWRAAWLPRTGELYMQRIGGVRPGGRVTVVGHFADEPTLGSASPDGMTSSAPAGRSTGCSSALGSITATSPQPPAPAPAKPERPIA